MDCHPPILFEIKGVVLATPFYVRLIKFYFTKHKKGINDIQFVIVFSGIELDDVARFLNDIKEQIEKLKIGLDDEEIVNQEEDINKKAEHSKDSKLATPKLNFVISTYYKGTGLEELLKRLEDYIDHANKNESEINNI